MPFKSIFPSIPLETEPYGERLLKAYQKHASQKAFICAENPDSFITYGDLHKQTLSVAAFLESEGFGHKDIAVLVMPDSWEYVEIFTAISLRGGSFSAASMSYSTDELRRQFDECQPKFIFCSDDNLSTVQKAIKGSKVSPKIVVCQIIDRNKPSHLPSNIIPFSTILSKFPNPKISIVNNIDVKKDVFVIQYTSGTTGAPKGVMLSHQNYSTESSIFINHFNKYVYPRIAPDWNYGNEAITFWQPFSTAYGLSILLKSMLCGQTCIIQTKFDKRLFLKTIQDFKIRELFVVPPSLHFFIHDPAVDDYDLSSLEFLHLSGAPTPENISQKVYEKLPHLKRIEVSFGTSECSFSALTNPINKKSRGDIAGCLCSNFEMKIIDENGKELGEGEKGELCMRGPTLMIGYLGKPDKTAEAIDAEGWFHCGDLAKYDKDGNIYIYGRIKEVIKTDEEIVAPLEIENVLLELPEINDAAVVAADDEKLGQVPKAFIVPNNENLSEEQIEEFVEEKIPLHMHLKGGIEFISKIPKSPGGKILRRLLEDDQNL